MESILKQIANPEWWFTVVIVGLIVGVVAAHAKEWLSIVLSSLSSAYRRQAARRKAARTEEIALLAANVDLLTVEYLRATLRLFGSAGLLLFSILLPVWGVLLKKFPEVDPLTHVLGLSLPTTWFGIQIEEQLLKGLFPILLMIPGLHLWVRFLIRYELCEQARMRAHILKNTK